MITEKELSEVKLSPTKKDYYQIWNELMELAEKISERWSPVSTNESDPGIVLLKALTAVADKLNYNIDKNTLEAFMPSATQEDSMRKLTEMMGYDMKHYRSATGKVVITYKSSNADSIESFYDGIYFPKFVNLKNEDEDINYITLEDFTIQAGQDSREVAVMEGELLECESNNDNIITLFQLDDLNRYILPEYTIAENGIFITNIKDSKESDLWKKESNLNTHQLGSKIYKVGFDSASQLPYIQFPEDIKTLIEDGLRIKYVRTNGLNGNIAAKVLSKIEKPGLWATAEDDLIKNLTKDSFAVANYSSISNGSDPESLNAAYNNYKKTIGTFDTLVTCRDYMNKIYQMTESDTDTTPLVSNIIVSDIRDDINRSIPICTFNEYGICYQDASLLEPITIELPNATSEGSTAVKYNENKIEHFDLIFYPFKPIYGLNNKTEYKNSFKYTAENMQKIKADLALNKTIAHNIVDQTNKEAKNVACIKNYLKLRARVSTTKKVTLIEESEILNNIYKAIYKNFNARQIDFGEEIPTESIISVIEKADYRIREVSLDEPALETKFCLLDGSEVSAANIANNELGDKLYNSLALRNVLAGKISAFTYNNDFISEFDKVRYPETETVTEGGTSITRLKYETTYPNTSGLGIKKITSVFDVQTAFANRDTTKEKDGLVLKENEVIQFRTPNFKTIKTYPAYVNYYLKLNKNSGGGINAIPATMQPLKTYMAGGTRWTDFVNSITGFIEGSAAASPNSTRLVKLDGDKKLTSSEAFQKISNEYTAIFKYDDDKHKYTKVDTFAADTTYYYFEAKSDNFVVMNNWIKAQDGAHGSKLDGIYRTSGVQEKPQGYLIDSDLRKYWPAYNFDSYTNTSDMLDKRYVQVTYSPEDPLVTSHAVTANGLGMDATYTGVPKDGEYQLKNGEYLLINYTDSKTDDAGTETKSVVNLEYSAGTIIRANFNLIDSTKYSVNHTYSKRDKFSFENYPTLPGMFTLGTNEQIEIREVVQVNLDDETMYLYWELNSDDPEKESNEFIFDEDYDLDDQRARNNYIWPENKHNAYTLKEGEHLYYTNSKKQDLVYYGAGTLIVRNQYTPDLIKYASSGSVSEEEIMTNGLAAAIPWQKYDLNSTSKRLEIIENKYVSLTEGDILISIDDNDPQNLNNRWQTIKTTAKYRFAEDDAPTTLPQVVVTGINWAVRSRLDFNMSKTVAQQLNRGDQLIIDLEETLTGVSKESVILQAAEINSTFTPMYVNSNYTCQAAVDTLNVLNSFGNVLDLKLKVSSKRAPSTSDGNNLLLNNYINGDAKYTKFDFENMPPITSYIDWQKQAGNQGKTEAEYATWAADLPQRRAFNLNINIPPAASVNAVSYGLLLIYYIEAENKTHDQDGHKSAQISAKTNSTPVAGLTLFNKAAIETLTSTQTLVPGMNIIKVLPEVTTLEFYADTARKSTVVFGSLDIVSGINSKLDYRITDDSAETNLQQLLKDIRDLEVADKFYYNIPIQSSSEIDLNAAVADDLLSSPATWYDINNVNRKFVISEIDAEYLPTGITLTKASRA
jgi:hypothetical protein